MEVGQTGMSINNMWVLREESTHIVKKKEKIGSSSPTGYCPVSLLTFAAKQR